MGSKGEKHKSIEETNFSYDHRGNSRQSRDGRKSTLLIQHRSRRGKGSIAPYRSPRKVELYYPVTSVTSPSIITSPTVIITNPTTHGCKGKSQSTMNMKSQVHNRNQARLHTCDNHQMIQHLMTIKLEGKQATNINRRLWDLSRTQQGDCEYLCQPYSLAKLFYEY